MAGITPGTMTSARESGGTLNGNILNGSVRDVYSLEILYQAQPRLIHAQFADVRTELGRQRGDTIKFTRYDELFGDSLLSEVEVMNTTHLNSHLISIEVNEHGYAVKESEYAVRTGWDDLIARATLLLGRHYGRTVDSMVRDEFRAVGSQQSVIEGGYANRSGITPTDTLSVDSIKDGREILATQKAPTLGGAYVCLVHPHQGRGLRDDPAWLEAHKYAAPENIFMGEIGMIEGVRFIETTATSVVQQDTGIVYVDQQPTSEVEPVTNANTDVYQSVMLGGNCVGWANGLPVQLRDNGVEDFGRQRSLGWYSIMGAGTIRSENAVLLETA